MNLQQPVGRPATGEAASYYFNYIDRVPGEDLVGFLAGQLESTLALLGGFSEPRSLHRYAADKWSARQVLGHVNDCERVFLFRAFWFARGFADPLPSFDQDVAARVAGADQVSWASHVEEFRGIRLTSLAFFRNLPQQAWLRRGIASDNPFTVRALAYVVAGHVEHHAAILRERYA